MLGNAEGQKKVDEFGAELNKHLAFITPITILDKSTKTHEREHTRNRDLYYFVRQARIIIAYFPADVPSPGVERELREAEQFGKTIVLIHPKKKIDNHPFRIPTDLRYETAEEFFEVLHGRNVPEALKPLLNEAGNPRYDVLYK